MKTKADISIILDRSGSMFSAVNETIEGFNSFLNSNKKNSNESRISLIQFDHEYQQNYEAIPIEDAKYLNNDNYTPRGSTALLDAIGKTIKNTSRRIKKLDDKDKPGKVFIVIITDGYENSSSQYSYKEINKMIRKKEDKKKWEFVYLGAGQDAIMEGEKFGVRKERAMMFKKSEVGIRNMFSSVHENIVMSMECKNKTGFKFKDSDREKQK